MVSKGFILDDSSPSERSTKPAVTRPISRGAKSGVDMDDSKNEDEDDDDVVYVESKTTQSMTLVGVSDLYVVASPTKSVVQHIGI